MICGGFLSGLVFQILCWSIPLGEVPFSRLVLRSFDCDLSGRRARVRYLCYNVGVIIPSLVYLGCLSLYLSQLRCGPSIGIFLWAVSVVEMIDFPTCKEGVHLRSVTLKVCRILLFQRCNSLCSTCVEGYPLYILKRWCTFDDLLGHPIRRGRPSLKTFSTVFWLWPFWEGRSSKYIKWYFLATI